jgi:hypothetical protein
MKHRRKVIISESLVALTGDAVSAAVLHVLLEEHKANLEQDALVEQAQRSGLTVDIPLTEGWVRKSARQLSVDLLGLAGRRTLARRLDEIVEQGWLHKRNNPSGELDRTYQYRPNVRKIKRDLGELATTWEDTDEQL